MGKDKYRALWTELLHWLNVRMPVWYSDWFRRLLPNMDGAGRDEFGIYLGTLADHSQYFRGMSSHPFINYVLLDAIDLATGVPACPDRISCFLKQKISLNLNRENGLLFIQGVIRCVVIFSM